MSANKIEVDRDLVNLLKELIRYTEKCKAPEDWMAEKLRAILGQCRVCESCGGTGIDLWKGAKDLDGRASDCDECVGGFYESEEIDDALTLAPGETLVMEVDKWSVIPGAPAAVEYTLHMGEALKVFEALKTDQTGRTVLDAELGAMGATEVTAWSTKIGVTLEMQESNGGCTLVVRPMAQ